MLFRCARSLARSRALPLAGAGLACIGVGAGSSFVSSAVCEPQSTPVPEGSKLLGKVALVTGSSEGIGAGIALAMAQAGADVCINFIGDPTPAEALADDIRKLGRRVVLSNADVSKRGECRRMFDAAEKQLGPVNILVTNAIFSTRNSLIDTQASEFEYTLQIGVMGVFHCFQIFAQRLIALGEGGSIVHISSAHHKWPVKEALDYNVAKAGAHHLALSAANELMWFGIRLNLVVPGWTLTQGELRLHGREVLDRAAALMPFGRLCAPSDVGKAAVWLSSDEAAYITGATLQVDGGLHIETAPSWQKVYPSKKGRGIPNRAAED
jgi:NAD(P)-dependent dehydrogenase (short-subunit alcohol dehydrogenase family)